MTGPATPAQVVDELQRIVRVLHTMSTVMERCVPVVASVREELAGVTKTHSVDLLFLQVRIGGLVELFEEALGDSSRDPR
ncbi:hypothetical protein [Amycolatopsis minnesotensis]|uniref:hypothetical protein n=1 Tax=Amycolatopsis minnesotensis TaxID=337894 RepID=UPI0031D6A5AE